MKISLSGFLFENSNADTSVPFDKFTRLASEAGYDGVELRNSQVNLETLPSEVQKHREILEQFNLTATCITARRLPQSGPERDSAFMGRLELAKRLECRLIKINSDAGWLRGAAEKANARSITLAANNHVGCVTETTAGTVEFFAGVGHPNFRLLFDPLHLRNSNQDVVDAASRLFPLICNVLIQSPKPETGDRKLFDEGAPDWPAILSALKSKGYDGLFTIIENGWPVEKREWVACETIVRLRRLWENA